MHGDDVGAGLGERLNILFGLDDHQVDVDAFLRGGSNRLDDDGANRDVGHEAAIHYVDVNPIGPRLIDRLDFGLKTAKISGKDRGGDSEGFGRAWHDWSQAPQGGRVNAHPFLDRATTRKRQ